MTRRLLLVSYYFPPVGGAGVQRPTKFVKYLATCGWAASVVSVDNPSVPALDAELASDVPLETTVRRARTFEPDYRKKQAIAANGGRGIRAALRAGARHAAALMLQPDPQILWAPDALRHGLALLRERRHDAILASGPPFTTFLVAGALSRISGLPLLLDYRDEWDISNAYWENKRRDRLTAGLQRWMEARVLRQARVVIATSRPSRDALADVCRRANSRAHVTCIHNGFDPEDFDRAERGRCDDATCRLAYVGTAWNLTSLEPLARALQLLCDRRPDLGRRIELVLAGRRVASQQDHVAALRALPCRLRELPYLSHTAAIRLMRDSDALVVLLSDVPSADRVVPAKAFEYMAARRPILAIAPPGELQYLLCGHPATYANAPSDTSGIADAIAAVVERDFSGTFDSWDPSAFSRASQARELATLLDGCCRTDLRAARAVPSGAVV